MPGNEPVPCQRDRVLRKKVLGDPAGLWFHIIHTTPCSHLGEHARPTGTVFRFCGAEDYLEDGDFRRPHHVRHDGLHHRGESFDFGQSRAADSRGDGGDVYFRGVRQHPDCLLYTSEGKGAKLRVAPINDAGELLLEEFDKLLGRRTKVVAVAHVSNALGTINPLKRMVALAHARGIPVVCLLYTSHLRSMHPFQILRKGTINCLELPRAVLFWTERLPVAVN